MGFGGSAGAMLASLKNNKRARPSAFKKLKESGVAYSTKTELYFDKKSTPAQLRALRKQIKRENDSAFIKKAIIIGILLVVIILVVGFIKF